MARRSAFRLMARVLAIVKECSYATAAMKLESGEWVKPGISTVERLASGLPIQSKERELCDKYIQQQNKNRFYVERQSKEAY